MDQSTYTNLTGKSVSNTAQFELQVRLARRRLEQMLGWPLVSSKWDDQYLELGKTRNEACACSSVDPSELDDPDEVQGSTRLFRWNTSDVYLPVDPLTTVYAVKLVSVGNNPGETEGITYRTFETDDYSVQWINAETTYARYIKLHEHDYNRYLPRHAHLYGDYCGQRYMVAIDADWGMGCVPLDIQAAWAELVAWQLDCKRDIKSESLGNHSYSKYDKRDPLTLYSGVLRQYAGPNGTLNKMPAVA